MLSWNLILFIVSLVFLIKSSRWLIKSLVALASYLAVSEYFISFIFLSFATTLPELVVGLNSSLSGFPELSVGNIFGSNIANLSLILGLTALIAGRINLKDHFQKHSAWPVFILGLSPALLLLDKNLSRIDGIILLSLFGGYLIYLIQRQLSRSTTKSNLADYLNHQDKISSLKQFSQVLGKFIFSAGLLLISANIIIASSVAIANFFNLSQLVIGVLLIAFGTSLPELIFALRSSLSKRPSLSFGNLIGASIFNSTWILGLVAVIHPITLSSTDTPAFYLMFITMALVLFISNIFLKNRGSIGRPVGLLLLTIYVLFIILNFTIYV